MNELLSICIPTYNRAEILHACLENLVPLATPYAIPIYISDNASTDTTEEVTKSFKQGYPHIYYSRNKENVKDFSFGLALKMAQSQYAWLFNDKSRIKKETLPQVLGELKTKEYALLILNLTEDEHLRVKDLPSPKIYTDPNQLLVDLGWHMTMVSSTIWSRRLIDTARFELFLGSPFMQLEALLNCLPQQPFRAYWEPRPLFYNAPVLSGWAAEKIFEFFIECWKAAIEGLPSPYQEDAKKQCIKNHGIKSGLFSYNNFVRFRKAGQYNRAVYEKYALLWDQVTDVPKWKLWLVAHLPPILV
jgi:glycosyltransferase involved in cell wall biosynthesis